MHDWLPQSTRLQWGELVLTTSKSPWEKLL